MPASTFTGSSRLRAGPTDRSGARIGAPRAAIVLAAAFAGLLSACSTPTLSPAVDVPAHFAATIPAKDTSLDTGPEVAWWEGFGDPILSGLVRRAAQESRDVKVAAERLRAARAGVTINRSPLAPSISAVGSASDRSSGYGDATKQLQPDTRIGSAGLEVSWEVDLSGRLRAGAAAAAADALAAEHGLRGVRLLVISDVARNYFSLVGAQRQLELLRSISATHDETLRLVVARHRAGLATPFDEERARTEAETARAQIPQLETVAAVSRHRLAVLTGDQAFRGNDIQASNDSPRVPEIRAGQPATLLQRRPDVQALMAQLDAANARRRQASAEWFPRLVLGASFGSQNVELNGTGLGSTRFTNAAGLLAMPLFNAGRTRALNEVAESGQREALLRAEDGIVRALEDVENALVALSSEKQRLHSLEAAAASADAALGRSQSLYDRGQIDLLPLLDAQRQRLSVRLASSDSATSLLLDSVQLYKALGGGWQVFDPPAADTARPDTAAVNRAPQS